MPEDLSRLRRRLLVHETARVLAEASSDPHEVILRILEVIGTNLEWELGELWEVDERAGLMRVTCRWSSPDTALEAFEQASDRTGFPTGVGLAGRVWEQGRAVWITDVLEVPGAPGGGGARPPGRGGPGGSRVVVGGRVLGAVEFLSRRPQEPDEELLEALTAVGTQLGQLLDRRGAERAVRESESRLRAIMDAALDCVIVMDGDGRVVEFNPSAEKTFGYPRDEVVGRPLAELFIPPSHRERHARALEEHLATGRRRIIGRRVEMPALRSDGSEFPVELSVTRVDLADAPLFVGHVRDVSAQKESERAVRRMREDLVFIAQASEALTSSLDYQETLRQLTRLVVPRLADWCTINVVEEDGTIWRAAAEHPDPSKSHLLAELMDLPHDHRDEAGVARVIRTGRTQVYREVDDELLRQVGRGHSDRYVEIVRRLGVSSVVLVPLTARGRVFGAMALVHSEPGRVHEEADLSLAEDLGRRAGLAIENARLFRERSHVAQTLQRSLLPPYLPSIPGIDVVAGHAPAGQENEVGGDFYDVFPTGPAGWGILIGDVQGKGPEAAALIGLVRHSLRTTAMHDPRPSRALAVLNEALLRQPSDRFCTVAYAHLRRDRRGVRVSLCCGGHPPPLIMRADGRIGQAGRSGTLLGSFEDPELTEEVVELRAGDGMLFYTDGVAGSEEGEVGRLVGVVRRHEGLPADRLAEAVLTETRGREPRDDAAAVVLRVLITKGDQDEVRSAHPEPAVHTTVNVPPLR